MPAPASERYRLLDFGPDPEGGPLADEALLAQAADGPVAGLWRASRGLVVPRTYAARPGFADAQAAFAGRGWPIHVRQSGGGVVPQGPGILNVSLARVFTGRPLDHSDRLYQHLCGLIAAALLFFGIEAQARAVEGSFCDGRYNLAVGDPARKVVGTAQLWRRVPAPAAAGGDRPGPAAGRAEEHHVGLAHALILLQCDTANATAEANALEAALRNVRRYDADRVLSLDACLPPAERAGFPAAFRARLEAVLRQASARI
ncbi:lipoate--protein ligase family protein [uncultured Castellaniella sp.]|uniref:lipoyl protein ligase domain-containing protein n=1 Tax=uncultured Castellaniella sp. TaxID=647907 RepID=UPI00260E7738|nr:lipoate--protein ligase family protein [uncultured Castellaniella sp.]